MARLASNLVFISHTNKTKLKDLFDRIHDEGIFAYIFPPPLELCDEEILQDEERAENLVNWKIENWNTSFEPEMSEEKCKISTNGAYLTLRFDTLHWPPIGIYDELLRQGYRVRAYYWEPDACICGSYINGELEHIHYRENEVDIPMDIDYFFPVSYFSYRENYEGQLASYEGFCDSGIDDMPETQLN